MKAAYVIMTDTIKLQKSKCSALQRTALPDMEMKFF